MCGCGPDVRIQEYQNQETVVAPEHFGGDYLDPHGKRKLLCIDRCILPEIRYLWSLGIRTYGSCCGHNVAASMINVHKDDDQKMIDMGYIRWPYLPEGICRQTFFCKSIQMAGFSPLLPEFQYDFSIRDRGKRVSIWNGSELVGVWWGGAPAGSMREGE